MGRRLFVVALALDVVGAGVALLVSTRPWQTVITHRPRPLADTVLHVSGRTIDAAPTALAVVALAGAVAVLATRGVVRRVIGVLVAVAGAALVWRSVLGFAVMGTARAQRLVASKHPGVALVSGTHVSTQALWPALSLLCGVLVAAAGAVIAARGHRWVAMSTRYDAPTAAADRARSDATMWAALERGEDPT